MSDRANHGADPANAASPPDGESPGGEVCRDPDAFVERLIELAVYAPVGVAVTLRDELPKHIRQGRQAVENRIQLARFIGQLAVQTGRRELQKRIEQQRAARQADGEPAATPSAREGDATEHDASAGLGARGAAPVERGPIGPSSEPTPFTEPTEGREADRGDDGLGDDLGAAAAPRVPTAAELPITDYESVPAINVVERLRSMTPEEIELVWQFERAHRSRRTILAKIEQLRERHAGG